ncbi:IbrB-like domain-containing protein [Klebsiella spallanzanii]|uniref:IbrB-like domain-containing protein n=1 Tax=Klebsiella spallanzanii TaxID=2587528 RepID=UPI00111BA1F9|nr:ParB/RepB/Spo0J family partition protein [Klebsiella spallanzanii]
MQRQLIQDIELYLQSLKGEEERINALNTFRQILHEYSPFKTQPVDCVLWVKQETVSPNDYNPNNLAPPEKRLLFTSLETDGFTQPIVVLKQGQEQEHYSIVDGFHRHELANGKAALKKRLKGYLPVTCLESSTAKRDSLMAATIRHNRARGRHQIHAMSEIVQELAHLGWSDDKIGKELGMDSDEVLRLKQINGLVEMFGDRQFSQAWTVK